MKIRYSTFFKNLLFCVLILLNFKALAQLDTTETRPFQFFPLPALSYSPETAFTFGLASFAYVDLAGGDRNARMSNLQLLAIYTSKSQLLIDLKWFMFTKGEQWIFSGRTFYHFFPDRHYGFGNNSNAIVLGAENPEDDIELLNYLPFDTRRMHFAQVVLKKIRKGLYAGLQFEYERLYKYQDGLDSILMVSPQIRQTPVSGPRTGLGVNITYDNRKNAVNPLKGTFVQFQNWFFREAFGGDYTYDVFRIDARQYINITKDHSLAIQLAIDHRESPNENGIPMRGLARFGGVDMVKGYFFGTYQSEKLVMFQTEYRMPIVKWSDKFPFFKGLGAVAFLGGGQVFESWKEFDPLQFRLAAGGGLRLSLDNEQRLNVGIDYGIGFHKNSGGTKRQTGFYFFMGETF